MNTSDVNPGKILIVMTFLALFGVACSAPEDPPPQEEPIAVTVHQVQYSRSLETDRFSGTVESQNRADLGTKVMGQINRLPVDIGDYVERGAVVAEIRDENLQAQQQQAEGQLQEARSALQNIKTNYERIKALYDQQSATRKELDDITSQYEAARARVQSLQGRLREIRDMMQYTVLRAPFDGYVVSKRVSEGDMANPGQPLLTLEQRGALKVMLTVPETQIVLFEPGDTVTVEVRAAGLPEARGVVASISPSGDRASRQFTVEIRLPEQAQTSQLRSGMFARVGLHGRESRHLVVPRSAVIERGQLTGVYTVARENEVMLRWIRLGREMEGQVEVLSGLAPGERIIAAPVPGLREGRKVRLQSNS